MPRSCSTSALIVLLISLTACGPRDLLLGTGAAVGTASLQERGLRGAASDYGLRLAINDAWFKASLDLYERASLMISNGRVVMIGRVPSEELRIRAHALAETAARRPVINRLTVGDDLGFQRELADKSISLQLQSALTFDRDVNAVNYDVATVNGVVYLIGEAQNEREERRVRYLATTISGVQAVESFIQVPEIL